MTPGVLRGNLYLLTLLSPLRACSHIRPTPRNLYLAYVHSQMNPKKGNQSWCQSVQPFDSFQDFLMCDPLKLGAHHAIFVGTTIVVRRDDGRRSSNDPLTPCDGRRLTAHTTRQPTTVEADNAPGRYSTFC